MTELEILMKQRAEIDKKIMSITTPKYEVWENNDLKADIHTTCDKCGGYWCVTIKEFDAKPMLNKHIPYFRRIIRADTKEDAITKLRGAINTLIQLYSEITGQAFRG